MTRTFYIDTTGVNGRQLVKLCSVFYGIHLQIHIVDQTNQCDAKSSKYRFTRLEWWSPKCAAITGVGVDMSPHCFIKCPNGSVSYTASGRKV